MGDFGFIVGCKTVSRTSANYVSTRGKLANFEAKRRLQEAYDDSRFDGETVDETDLSGGMLYSLPGGCPDAAGPEKNRECRARMPGGHCKHPSGSQNCTYSYERAGEVRLDELSGLLEAGFPTYGDFSN